MLVKSPPSVIPCASAWVPGVPPGTRIPPSPVAINARATRLPRAPSTSSRGLAEQEKVTPGKTRPGRRADPRPIQSVTFHTVVP